MRPPHARTYHQADSPMSLPQPPAWYTQLVEALLSERAQGLNIEGAPDPSTAITLALCDALRPGSEEFTRCVSEPQPAFVQLEELEPEDKEAALEEYRERKVCVGEGAAGGPLAGFRFYMDLEEPVPDSTGLAWSADTILLCSPCGEFPPFLWVPLGTSLDAVTATLADYVPTATAVADAQGEEAKSIRMFLGSHDMGLPGITELEKLFVKAFCDEGSTERAAEGGEQEEEGPRTSRITTAFSHSVLTIEEHPQLAVMHIQYKPAGQDTILEGLNELFGEDWAIDLPLDVLGALMGMTLQSARQVREDIMGPGDDGSAPHPQNILSGLYVVAFLQDPGLYRDLNRFKSHEDVNVRIAVASLAAQTKCTTLVEEMIGAERDPEVKAFLSQFSEDAAPNQ